MSQPTEPTGQQCNENARLPDMDGMVCYACWYPRMGGYAGKAVVAFHPSQQGDHCFDVYVWHDGNFPFGDDNNPAHLHHCSAVAFIDFGQFVMDAQTNHATAPNQKSEPSGSQEA